jgi:hypothetical protein
MQVVVGLALMIVGFAELRWLARWAGAGRRFPPSFLRILVSLTLGFGFCMGGLYYAQTGSAHVALEGAVFSGVGYGVLMTGLFAAVLGFWRAFSPRSYAFAKAWTDAHADHGLPLDTGLRRNRRQRAVMKEFRERWEREPYPISAGEFIGVHWEEIAAAGWRTS